MSDPRTRALERALIAEPTLEAAHALLGTLLRFMPVGEANLELDRVLRATCCPPEPTGRTRPGLLAPMPGAYYGHMLLELTPQELLRAGAVITTRHQCLTYSLDREQPLEERRYDVKSAMVRLNLPDGRGGESMWFHDEAGMLSQGCNTQVWSQEIRRMICQGHPRSGIMLAFAPGLQRGLLETNGTGAIEVSYSPFSGWHTMHTTRLKPGFTERHFVLAAANLYHEALRDAIRWAPSLRVHRRFANYLDNLPRSLPRSLIGLPDWHPQVHEADRLNRSEAYESVRLEGRDRGVPPIPDRSSEQQLTEEQAAVWDQILGEFEEAQRREEEPQQNPRVRRNGDEELRRRERESHAFGSPDLAVRQLADMVRHGRIHRDAPWFLARMGDPAARTLVGYGGDDEAVPSPHAAPSEILWWASKLVNGEDAQGHWRGISPPPDRYRYSHPFRWWVAEELAHLINMYRVEHGLDPYKHGLPGGTSQSEQHAGALITRLHDTAWESRSGGSGPDLPRSRGEAVRSSAYQSAARELSAYLAAGMRAWLLQPHEET